MLKSMKRKALSGELALIEEIRRRTGRPSGAVRMGIGDDCAILKSPKGSDLLITTDFSLEGRHFRRNWHSARSIGHRTLARGLSDLAAMGGRPIAAFLSVALPVSAVRRHGWMDGFLGGFTDLADAYGAVLAGGDTSESPSDHVLADIILLGSAPTGTALRRSGANPGDNLYCTGSLGGAAAELAELGKSPRRFRVATAAEDHPHLFPVPRLKAGEALRKRKLATACLDISDGLSNDLAHLCESSGVRAEVSAPRLPLHPLAQALGAEAGLAAALHGGEDYELLFTARAGVKMPRMLGGVAITQIGRIAAKRKNAPLMTLIAADGTRTELTAQGWEHLQ
jgi:thiamine-monophosphate kinase